MVHKSVLLNESIGNLMLGNGKIFFDGTLGAAGHTIKACNDFGEGLRIVATDKDTIAIENAKLLLKDSRCKYDLVQSDYRKIDPVIKGLGLEKVDAILLDLGLSSDQLENSGRGFTFQKDEPLLMTFGEITEKTLTAEMIVNHWSEETIADIIYGFSDERFAKRIAREILESRREKEIKTTNDLVRIIEKAVPASYKNGKKINPSTKTFQALRMAVNDELGALKEGMESGWKVLNEGGRMAIISFHSVEDREVKNFFKAMEKSKEGKLINKKPIIATDEEMKENPRSRSAKLRVIEKI